MLIPLQEIVQKYSLNIKGVIQVGSHWCEEHDIYVQLGIKNIAYIEPCREAFDISVKKLFNGIDYVEGDYRILLKGVYMIHKKIIDYIDRNNIKMLRCACGEEEGEFDMYVSNNNQGQSNSLLKPKLHLQQHPEVVFTDYERVKVIPLDKLPFKKEDYNLLVMDVQGAEGLVLKGATETLKHIDCIYTEVNRGQTYEGNMEIDEMDLFLADFGFTRVETEWASANLSWGDSVYVKQ